ncbi:Platelet-activating factor acetylhydrolase [Coccomyxa sp. Obi]|nr:Platelet-activating factor acetylhydrolase [Coccomyxa sp. Obi]
MPYVPAGPYSVGVCDIEYLKKSLDQDSSNFFSAQSHLVGRIFYPCNAEAVKHESYHKPCWLPSWTYARGYGAFLTAWGGTSWAKSLLKPTIQGLSYSLGHQVLIDNFMHAPIAERRDTFPVVIFSHGIGGTRNAYSGICSELGSAGFVVLAVEHADGTASTVQLAGKQGTRFYGGWLSEEERLAQTRYRMGEVATAYDLLSALQRRTLPEGLKLSGGLDPVAFFGGRLDQDRASLMGHSYGGATVTALTAQDDRFRAGVALDPWWGALPADSPALLGWKTDSPLLVMGSHTWNTPNEKGRLFCDGVRQPRVFAAAASRAGAVHLVLEGSSHDTFNDAVMLVALRFKGAMNYVRSFKKSKTIAELDAELALPLVANSALAFLRRHLALGNGQIGPLDESMQANSKRLEAIEARIAFQATSKGKPGAGADAVSVEAHGETAAAESAHTPTPHGGAGEPDTMGGPGESAGSLAAAAYLRLEEGADEASAAAHSGKAENGLGLRGGVDALTVQPAELQQQPAAVAAPDSDRGDQERVCRGHIWKLDTYGL